MILRELRTLIIFVFRWIFWQHDPFSKELKSDFVSTTQIWPHYASFERPTLTVLWTNNWLQSVPPHIQTFHDKPLHTSPIWCIHTLKQIHTTKGVTSHSVNIPFGRDWQRRLSVCCSIALKVPPCTRGPFCWHGLTLIPAYISNYMLYNVWNDITYAFLNFNDATVEV